MISDADLDPIAEEGRCILAEDPALRSRLQEFVGRLDRGEVQPSEVTSTDEVRQRFSLPPGADRAAAG